MMLCSRILVSVIPYGFCTKLCIGEHMELGKNQSYFQNVRSKLKKYEFQGDFFLFK